MRVAALLTCHNRRETTLRCLRRLIPQLNEAGGIAILVDDGSTDGTSPAVSAEFPEVVLLQGSGNLYWTGGMRLAEETALAGTFDAQLWVNDDTEVYEGAVHDLITIAARTSSIVVGPCRDPDTGRMSYGGVRHAYGMRFELAEPKGEVIECDTMNGNVVLVPTLIVAAIGGLDPRFPHSMADFDFGLRARRAGFQIHSLGKFAGDCRLLPDDGRSTDPTLPMGVRLKRLVSTKELPPGPWLAFARRHAGWAWPMYWISPYLRAAAAMRRRKPLI